jgi:endonuclease/exonuclease/phosphatase family metal-dependent hydrolase
MNPNTSFCRIACLVLVVTHFDNDLHSAREKSARLVRERVEALDTTLPVILTGDFNAAAGTNQACMSLTSDGFFADTWVTARTRKGEGLGTSNGFEAVRPNGVRIDWILTRGSVSVDSAESFTFSRGGQFPSDHCPVVARLHIAR